MTGNTYIFNTKITNATAVFVYTLNGNICEFKLEGNWTANAASFLYKNFPFKESEIKPLAQVGRKYYEIKKVEADISFDRFWKEYPYNGLSKKKIARQRYEKLTDNEKHKLLMMLPRYKRLKQKDNTRFPYAEVFINQRWWDE